MMRQGTNSGSRGSRFVLIVATAATIATGSAQDYRSNPVWWNAGEDAALGWAEAYDNPDGDVGILNKNGGLHTTGHPFFEALGTNGRACVTCHQPAGGMGISAATLRERWTATEGKDPVFAAVDGSNCPDLPQSAAASHSLALERGLFRIALPWPPKTADGTVIKPEFRIEVVRDPTGCNLSPIYGLKSKTPMISVFRRPRIAANLEYVLSGALMADGREPTLRSQAVTAIMTHEEAGKPPSDEQLRRIVEFEMHVFAAQRSDIRGGLLNEEGGPLVLGADNLAGGKSGRLGDSGAAVLASFSVWRKGSDGDPQIQQEFRASVVRGSDVFFTRTFRIRDASGSRMYTCATCHAADAPRWMDIGTTNVRPEKASPELPLFRITCDASALDHPLLGRVFYTQDPGRGLISGKCAEVGSMVPQQLRALAARAPYFSNGSARTLRDVVDYYDHRFDIGYSEQEKRDLINFLRVL